MIELDLGRFKKARIWLDNMPERINGSTEESTLLLPAGSESLSTRSVAVEVCVPTGPRVMYGMLGGTLSPRLPKQLSIKLSGGECAGTVWPSSLLAVEPALFGLPVEYIDAVKSGLKAAQEDEGICGELRIAWAAYGVMSSNYIMFNRLASVLLKLLSVDVSKMKELELVSLFPTRFS